MCGHRDILRITLINFFFFGDQFPPPPPPSIRNQKECVPTIRVKDPSFEETLISPPKKMGWVVMGKRFPWYVYFLIS